VSALQPSSPHQNFLKQPQDDLLVSSVSLSTISSTFNSLFKVLFIFPSRYLFAIGLSPVFSLRWNLPPALGCIPEQPDSMAQQTVIGHNNKDKHGTVTLCGAPFQGTSCPLLQPNMLHLKITIPSGDKPP